MLAFLLLFVAMLALCDIFWIIKWRYTKCKGVLPPGSIRLPFVGETLELIFPSYSLDIHPFFKKRIQKYGPIFQSNIACQPIVISVDPEFNNHIITQNGISVELWYLSTFSKLFALEGESKTNITGSIHKFIRKAILNRLGTESLKEKFLPRIENMVKETLYSWSNQDVVDVKYDVSSTICNFTYKLLCDYDGKGSHDKLSESFTIFSESLLGFPLNIPGTKYHTCLKNKETVLSILRKRIEQKRASQVEKQAGEDDFLDLALKQNEIDSYFTDDFIMNLLFASLFATFDSISIIIILMLKLLSSHPPVLLQLMVEHERILQNRRPDCPITWEEYKSMTYTHQVI
ncbi:cucurbitadienol 11-hydroxylase-like [Mercurialis annua]|uniref:cucurbitadienol 11-hydroxylase-like n=1 Tax=Mercurialis annua TaxID=3986 RepID=UPI002160EBFF|nr:cucurbitadienol 11-hydroxylase-like [Mercurialis annua]